MDRVKALNEIAHINRTYCDGCVIKQETGSNRCSGCEHFERLRSIGDDLTREVKVRRMLKYKGAMKYVK